MLLNFVECLSIQLKVEILLFQGLGGPTGQPGATGERGERVSIVNLFNIINIYIHAHIYVNICTCIIIYTCTHIFIPAQTHINMYIHTIHTCSKIFYFVFLVCYFHTYTQKSEVYKFSMIARLEILPWLDSVFLFHQDC